MRSIPKNVLKHSRRPLLGRAVLDFVRGLAWAMPRRSPRRPRDAARGAAGILMTLFSLVLLMQAAGPACAATSAAGASAVAATAPLTLSPAQARGALAMLDNPTRRAQLEDALRAIAVAGAVAAPAPASAASAPQAASGSAAAASPFSANGLARQLARPVTHWLKAGVHELRHSAAALLDLGSLHRWWAQQLGTPEGRVWLRQLIGLLALVLGPALLIEWALRRITARPRAALAARAAARSATAADPAKAVDSSAATPAAPADGTPPAPHDDVQAARDKNAAHHWVLLRRLPTALLNLLLSAVPLFGFGLCAIAVMSATTDDGSARDNAISAVIGGYLICRALLLVTAFFFAPQTPSLRMLRLKDGWARFGQRWACRIVIVAGVGSAGAQAMEPFGLTSDAHIGILKIVALICHVLLAIVVIRCRRPIARWIRSGTARHRSLSYFGNWLADVWAGVTVFIVLALWFVWAFDVRHGYETLLRHGAISIAVLVLARVVAIIVFGALDRALRRDQQGAEVSLARQRVSRYLSLLHTLISVVIGLVTVVILLNIWGVHSWHFLAGSRVGHRLLSALITIGVAVFVAVLVWEALNVATERRLDTWTASGDFVRAARLRTLLPMLRTTLLIVILLVVGLTGLSEIGVNTGPLLAGASIFGVALGFGSQKLVQDFITGIFLLMENALQVGDWVTLASVSGTVEYLSIRTVRLRGGDGSLYTVPFSSVTTVNNTNRGLGNAAVKVVIAHGEDVGRAVETLTEIGAQLRADDNFKDGILGDFSYWGVDQIDGANVTLVGQIQCRDARRWPVQREFNRRILDQFAAKGIELANPQRNFVIGPQDGDRGQPPAAPRGDAGGTPAAAAP